MAVSPAVFFVVDFPLGAQSTAQRLRLSAPFAHVRAYRAHEVAAALEQIAAATAQGAWAVGYVAYEAAAGLDEKLATSMRIAPDALHSDPLLAFALFHGPDAPSDFAQGAPVGWVPQSVCAAMPVPQWQVSEDAPSYAQKIATLRQAIAAGDLYQANYTLRASASTGAHFAPWHYYEALRQRQQAAYSAYLDFGEWQILSLSPELFFDWHRVSGQITTRPMKGTAPRGATPAHDAANAAHLQTSPKERAENVMIVDLLRNDLGRIAQTGSVRTTQLLHTQAYPTLWQMTSTVQATTRPDVGLPDVLRALFPCGSITGAPKRMAMQKIAGLESSPRGVYCGAVGVINAERAVFNVAIRTVQVGPQPPVLDEKTAPHNPASAPASQPPGHVGLHCGTGGGITWPSDAQAEYAEALLKMRFLQTDALPLPSYALRETLLLADGRYALLSLHLQRLAQSAVVCGFRPVSAQAHRATLQDFAAAHAQGAWRVQLTQNANGVLQVQGTLLDAALPAALADWPAGEAAPRAWLAAPAQPQTQAHTALRVALAAQPNTPADLPWLLHKTTHRGLYDHALAQAPKGTWDVLLHTADGFATECTRGNIVLQTAQGCLTPPAAHGLLPGTLREALLHRGVVREQAIALGRLQHPEAGDVLWFINGVRGWLPLQGPYVAHGGDGCSPANTSAPRPLPR